jgi:proteasome lid subunit RPN8/RPN11
MHGAQVQPARAKYGYRLEFGHEHGPRVQEVPLAPADFSRAVEAAFFDGLRRGVFTHYEPPLDRAYIEPRFAVPSGHSPEAVGFSVALPTPGGGEHRLAFDSAFFRSLANRIAAERVRAQHLPDSPPLLYQLAAYLDGDDETPFGRPGLTVEPASVVVAIRPLARAALGRAEPWDSPRPEDLPVLVPRRVLEEAVDEARRSPDREVGGVLLGHLRRDPGTGELFLHITALVPAEGTEATGTSVTFTPATWARVRDVVALRGEGEIFAGWVHSHPFRFCAQCPLPTPPECVAKVLFYSADDEFRMELSFARPFMVGLLSAVEPRLEPVLGHLPVRLYGWRGGAIHARGFEVIDV